MNKVPFESNGFSLESEGFLSGFIIMLRFYIYFDKLCNDKNEFVTKPNSSTLLALLALFSLWLEIML